MKIKSLLNNGWTIGIGTFILGSIILDSLTKKNILGKIWKVIVSIIDFFLLKFEVSLWVLIIIPFAGIGILFLIAWIVSAIKQENSSKPAFFDYTEDTFDGVLYRWEYQKYSGKYDIPNILPFCPKCRCRLVYGKCPNCNVIYSHRIKEHSEIYALITHKIENEYQ